jgi:hypothetical protein
MMLILLVGCREQRDAQTGVWSKPEEMAKSSDSLSTSFSLYKWNSSLLAIGGDSGTFASRVLDEDGKNWKTLSTANPGWLPMNVDSRQNRFVVSRATIWTNSVNAQFVIGSLSPDGRFISETTTHLILQQSKLFPNDRPDLEMSPWGRPVQAMFVGGAMDDAEIRVPYTINANSIERRGHQIIGKSALDVSANGVFASSDGGQTWRDETISIRESLTPTVCRTRGFYYYFALAGQGGSPFELWYSRSAVGSTSWDRPETLNKTGADNYGSNLHTLADGDTVHLCWLDCRHEKTSFSLMHPRSENYEVAYCHRKDTDSCWGKDVILSEGLRYAYSPSISVEGDKVVVAWAGVKSDKDGRNEWNPSDIYYVTSKDGGKTWAKPMQVTDGFKNGITSGKPQVALYHNVIHLFYIQGKLNYQEVSSGAAKLNQPPWPIYYTQRPFPN